MIAITRLFQPGFRAENLARFENTEMANTEIENKQRVDNQPQLKVYALLMRDVLPSRAKNSAND